jgi:hypothetical protein
MQEIYVPTGGRDGRPESYLFSNDWFEQHTLKNWERHVKPRADGIRRYLEIGVCDGKSMCWMLDNVLTKAGDRAWGIDPYISKDSTREDWCAEIAEMKRRAQVNLSWAVQSGRLEMIFEQSQLWLRRQESLNLDMVFVDGSHSAKNAMEDMVLSFHMLRRGGIMVIDDLDRRWRRGAPSVWEAARGFTDAYEGIINWVYRDNRQCCIERRK